jgi:hypothetical protein
MRRDGRVAEGARLESVYTFTGIVGSNPTLSASPFVFIDLSAIHTVIHTVKLILGAVCDAIFSLFASQFSLSRSVRQQS